MSQRGIDSMLEHWVNTSYLLWCDLLHIVLRQTTVTAYISCNQLLLFAFKCPSSRRHMEEGMWMEQGGGGGGRGQDYQYYKGRGAGPHEYYRQSVDPGGRATDSLRGRARGQCYRLIDSTPYIPGIIKDLHTSGFYLPPLSWLSDFVLFVHVI